MTTTPPLPPSPSAQRPQRRLWALSDWPTRTLSGHIALAGALVSAVTFETVHFAGNASWANLVVLASGLFASACAIPLRRPALVPRAVAAAAVSLTCTVVMLAVQPAIHVWGIGESAAQLVLLAGVVRRLPRQTAIGLGSLLALAAGTTPPRDTHAGPVTAAVAALTVAVTGLSIYLRAQDVERDRAVERARTGERLELARELHDFVAHHVTGILVQAQTARAVPADPAANAARLERIEAAAAEALTAMRRVVRVLREQPSATTPAAGLGDIDTLVTEFRATGPPVVADVDHDLRGTLAPDLAACAHRIVREALTNIRKHAPGSSRVGITLRRTGDGVLVDVINHPGATPAQSRHGRVPKGGFGLLGLSERVTAMGGAFTAGPTPSGEWRVTAVLPEQTGDRAADPAHAVE